MDRICDEKGIDTIEMGCTMAVAMDGGVLNWGDSKAGIELLKKVGSSDAMGRIIGNGADFAGQAFGVDRIPTVKGQGLPAYDPRSVRVSALPTLPLPWAVTILPVTQLLPTSLRLVVMLILSPRKARSNFPRTSRLLPQPSTPRPLPVCSFRCSGY